MNLLGKTLFVLLAMSLIIAACATASTSSPAPETVTIPECANNPEDKGICLQRTVIVDDVGQVFRLQSFEPPAQPGALMSLNVQHMAPGAFPWSKWDWSEYYVSNLDPISFAAWGNPAEPCEATGTTYTQELAYNSVTWTGTSTDEMEIAGLDGTYIHFDQATLTSISMNNSLPEGSCYTNLYIRGDLVQ